MRCLYTLIQTIVSLSSFPPSQLHDRSITLPHATVSPDAEAQRHWALGDDYQEAHENEEDDDDESPPIEYHGSPDVDEDEDSTEHFSSAMPVVPEAGPLLVDTRDAQV